MRARKFSVTDTWGSVLQLPRGARDVGTATQGTMNVSIVPFERAISREAWLFRLFPPSLPPISTVWNQRFPRSALWELLPIADRVRY